MNNDDKPALVLVHVEETFRAHFPPGMLSRIRKAIRQNRFSEVIHATSYINDEEPVEELAPYVTDEVAWGWGYEPESFRHHNRGEARWLIPTASAHEWTWIPPTLRAWQGRLQNSEVVLGGGCEGECLADMEAVLDALQIPYELNRDFVYWFRG